MSSWRLLNRTWCLWPSRPIAIIEMIGGSYVSASPHLSYKRFLDGLGKKGFAIHAWSYLPTLDHQAQANEAWKDLRKCREKLQSRISNQISVIRIGHSLGCKLHLLAPDRGRNCQSFVALSFNNYTAENSIPMFSEIGQRLGIDNEFRPSPNETIKLISQKYFQPKNLIIKFKEDNLDESQILLISLKRRECEDFSHSLEINGDHLTPVSLGIRQKLLRKWSNNNSKQKSIEILVQKITDWCLKESRSQFIQN